VVAPGRVIDRGTVVIRDGILEAVGAGVEPPPDARVWDLEGLTVYPGLVDPYSTRSWPAQPDEDTPDPGAGAANPMVHPEREMAAWGLEPATAERFREAGYTTVAVASRDGLLRGWSAVVEAGDGPVREQLLASHLAQTVDLGARSEDGYPESLMGSVALTRQSFLDARWYTRAQAAYARNPAQRRPTADASLAALAGAAAGEAPVVFENDDLLATLRAARFAHELGLDAWLVASGREYERADEVAAAGFPLIVPLDFPEPPKPAGDELSVSLEDLRHWKRAPGNPAALAAAGVTFAITSHRLDQPKELHERLARAIAEGLPADAALAAVTTEPARLLGLADRIGTVEAGKLANLVVAEGDLFTKETSIRAVWVDGRRYDVEEILPPEIEPAGEWELRVDAGGDTIPVTLVLRGEAPTLTGTLTARGTEIDLTGVRVSGASVEITFDGASLGMPGSFEMTFDVEGDRAEGAGTGPSGSFTLEGTRVSKPSSAPEPEEAAP
jgi:imidazolonepropionase-like amidohydrolase